MLTESSNAVSGIREIQDDFGFYSNYETPEDDKLYASQSKILYILLNLTYRKLEQEITNTKFGFRNGMRLMRLIIQLKRINTTPLERKKISIHAL